MSKTVEDTNALAYSPPEYTPRADGDRASALDVKDEVAHYDATDPSVDRDFVYVPDTEEERRLVRKIDMRLIPMLWVMYILNYVSGLLVTSWAPVGSRSGVPETLHFRLKSLRVGVVGSLSFIWELEARSFTCSAA